MSESDTLQQIDETQQTVSRSSPDARARVGARPLLLAKLLLLLGGTVLGLALAEISMRVFAAVTHRVPLVESDERAGWAHLPNLRNLIRGGEGGRYSMSTDALGHRLTRAIDEPPSENRPTVIVVGDSFAQSAGVDDRDAFPWIIAHDLPVNVVNLGVLGYGTDQELVSLEAYLEAHPAVNVRDVVVFVSHNDFFDVQIDYHYLARHKPRFQLVDGRLVRDPYRLGLSDRVMDVSYLFWLVNSKYAEYIHKGPTDPSAGTELVIACLANMRDVATRRGARFHVFVHHMKHPNEISPMPDSWWADFSRRAEAIDITERLPPPDGADPFCYDRHHWSKAVHERAAALVKERLEATSLPK